MRIKEKLVWRGQIRWSEISDTLGSARVKSTVSIDGSHEALKWMDGWTDGQTDGRTDGRTDGGRTEDGRTDGRTDRRTVGGTAR